MDETYTVQPSADEKSLDAIRKEKAEKMEKLMKEEIASRNGEIKVYSLNDFEIGCPLGRGKFGRVYLAREKKTGYIVALKTLFFSELRKHRMELQVIRELEINIHLSHPNILTMFTTFSDVKRFYLVLEYACFGDVFSVQQRMPGRRFPEPQAANYSYQVASALDYCHSKSVLHRDIKPENLLLTVGDIIKLADFGWSVHLGNSKRTTMCGTLDYLPPEMVQRKPYNYKVDNWCLGVLSYEFLYGNPPFESNSQDDTYKKILSLKVNYPSFLSTKSRDFIKSLLKINPAERITLKDAMAHPWIVESKDLPYRKLSP